MSDDRFTREPGDDSDEANANGERPYLDGPPPPGTRPLFKPKPPWFRDAPNQHISADEIAAFIQREWPAPDKRKREPT